MNNTYLAGPDYAKIIELTPVLCVDIVLIDRWMKRTNNPNKYILFKRNNEPLKNEFWVVGGRVAKGETLVTAALRKLFEETRLVLTPIDLLFVGYYEENFEFSSIGRGPYHTVSIVFEAVVDKADIKLDSQHSECQLSSVLPRSFTTKLQQPLL